MTKNSQKINRKKIRLILKECIQIETFNQDTLKTLNLYNSTTGYNNAAGILADKNHFPGIDMVKFGEIGKLSVLRNRNLANVCYRPGFVERKTKENI